MPRVTAERLLQQREDYDLRVAAYLSRQGWVYTCDTPGAYWLWSHPYKGQTILVDQAHALSIQAQVESGVYRWE